MCDIGNLEDEYHHVLFCDAFIKTRTEFFGELHNVKHDSKETVLSSIFKTENLEVAGRYIEQMFVQRRELLYKYGIEEWVEDIECD